MNAPVNVNLFELLNFCLQQHPEALGVFALNPRAREVRMPRKAAPSGGCFHRPSGEQDLVGAVLSCWCDTPHGRAERCTACGEMIPFHDFPGREPRVTFLTLELPERVGQNLKGAEEDHAFLVAFSIDRAVYDEFTRRAASPIILPAGALS